MPGGAAYCIRVVGPTEVTHLLKSPSAVNFLVLLRAILRDYRLTLKVVG